ncbi:hypothetical protein [Citrobacter amalonaticus]|uniref:hypothetical protein n=1 Tax=Citrobacter amalonaticus TaxID=35703 RepID=UPI003D80AE1B
MTQNHQNTLSIKNHNSGISRRSTVSICTYQPYISTLNTEKMSKRTLCENQYIRKYNAKRTVKLVYFK